MNFWKNAPWEDLERKADGDTMRGLPRNDFPWKLADERFADAESDMWEVRIHCLAIVPTKNAKLVKATLEVQATCAVSDTNLARMGLTPDRLRSMHDGSTGGFSERRNRDVELPLADVEKICRKWLASIRADLLLRYTFNTKQKLIWEKVRAAPVSRFS